MKGLNLVFILAITALVSCTKKEDVSLAKSDAVSLAKLQSELIIGSWQLTSTGTLTQVSTTTAPSTGCGSSGSGDHMDIIWTSTSQNENMSFKSSGDYLKSSANDAACSGTYKVSNGAILTKTSCSVDEQKHAIYTIDATTMVIEEDRMMYKYEKK
jgi:hypothetical protein